MVFKWNSTIRPASNPGPYHFRSTRPSWKGTGKTAGHLCNVRSMDRFDRSFSRFFTLTVARVPCYEMSRAYITGLQLVGWWASTKPSCLAEVSDLQAQSDSIGNQTIRVLNWSHTFGAIPGHALGAISVSTDSQEAEKEKPVDKDPVQVWSKTLKA